MKLTFLIGNGFDLNQGLKTSYPDFFKKYVVVRPTDTNALKRFKTVLLKEKNNWSDLEVLLGQITSSYSLEGKHDFLGCLQNLRECLAHFIEIGTRKFRYRPSRQRKELKRSLLCWMEESTYAFPGANLVDNAEGKITSIDFVSFNYNPIIFTMLEKIKQKERRSKDKLIGELVDIKRNMVHMNYKRGFVLGVNDETQISNVSFIGDVGIELSLIKSKQRTFYELQNFPEYIKNSDIIYMFGLSMGETDKMYWDYIYQWLKKKKSHTLIFNTYNKYCNPLDLIEIKKIVSNARSRIDAYMPSVSSQIRVVVNANIFSFRKRIPFIK